MNLGPREDISILNTHKFIADSVWIGWSKDKDGIVVKKQIAVICVKQLPQDVSVIHPITDFLLTHWRYRSYNTQRKHAQNVVMFLNFIILNKKTYNLFSILDLDIPHAEKFLTKLTESSRALDTVKAVERTLVKFYEYLSKHDCLPKVSKDKFRSYKDDTGQDISISPFVEVIYPSRKASMIEHSFPIEYLPLLFEVAITVARPIALGIYLQIFGGLRVGEVVNIRRASIRRRVKNDGLLLKIEEQSFRTDIKDSSGANYVKNPRIQQVFLFKDWFETLYQDHIELYKDKDGSGALFINRDGKAMSAESYRQYFDKVKFHFIQILRHSKTIEHKILAHHLSTMRWSTHIGRGIFSNMLASYAQNPYEIAVPRGDTSLLSSLSYLKKTDRMRMKLEEGLYRLHNEYIPHLIERRKNPH